MKFSIHSFTLLTTLLLAGCSEEPIGEQMTTPFIPPGLKSLAEIDEQGISTYGTEPIVVTGIVSESSQGGWMGINEHYEIHSFALAAWQPENGSVHRGELSIIRAIPPKHDRWGDFPGHSIQTMKILLSGDEEFAIFVNSMPGKDASNELLAIREELKKPVILSTDQFGELVLDRRLNWFECEAEWMNQSINLSFDNRENNSIETGLASAEKLWTEQSLRQERINEIILKELLSLKNEMWLEDGERELTPVEFLKRIALESISIGFDGGFEFGFDDGDLFWGHMINVRGTHEKGLFDAGI